MGSLIVSAYNPAVPNNSSLLEVEMQMIGPKRGSSSHLGKVLTNGVGKGEKGEISDIIDRGLTTLDAFPRKYFCQQIP